LILIVFRDVIVVARFDRPAIRERLGPNMDNVRGIGTPAFVLFALMLFGAASLVWAERVLPERVASHFGADGKPDGWMSRERSVQAMGIIGFVMPLGLVGIGLSMRVMPSDLINVPRRDYWLSPEHRGETDVYLARQFTWMACLVMALFIAINWLTIEANRQAPPRLSNAVWALLVVFLASVTLWIARLVWHFSRPPSTEAPRRR
jgi:hypothetical protein